MVRWKPLAIARNASSTTTTSAIAMTVDSDSQRRCAMLLRLIDGDRNHLKPERTHVYPPSERSGDLQPHGVDRRNDAR